MKHGNINFPNEQPNLDEKEALEYQGLPEKELVKVLVPLSKKDLDHSNKRSLTEDQIKAKQRQEQEHKEKLEAQRALQKRFKQIEQNISSLNDTIYISFYASKHGLEYKKLMDDKIGNAESIINPSDLANSENHNSLLKIGREVLQSPQIKRR